MGRVLLVHWNEAEAIERLWSAIFRACRVDQDDPVAAWRAHVADLDARSRYLTSRSYTSLRYEGPGTELTLGLPEGTIWIGGNAGLGYYIQVATGDFNMRLALAAIIMLTALGLLLYFLVILAEMKLIPWHESQRESR